jgi:hypothetical protein
MFKGVVAFGVYLNPGTFQELSNENGFFSHICKSKAYLFTVVLTFTFIYVFLLSFILSLSLHSLALLIKKLLLLCMFRTIIQSDSWLVDITARDDSLGLCDQKSSHKHVSDFGRLPSYGNFLIPVCALVWTAFTEPADGWYYQRGGLSFALQALFLPPDAPTQLHYCSRILTLPRHLGNGGMGGWVGRNSWC